MKDERVTFYIPDFSKSYRECELCLDDYDFFSSWHDVSIRAWLVQTFLRLKKLGLNVHISDDWPKEGLVVLLSNKRSLNNLKSALSSLSKDLIIVTIRADEIQWRNMLSDIDIVQNGLFANGKDCFFIPHWPQPGIIRRNPLRGHRIENLVFKGGKGSLDDAFFSDMWFKGLKDRNINWLYSTEHTTTNWRDYSEADIVLAVRPQFGDRFRRSDKPASKLINSWHAEVPVLLGSEAAYLEVKKSYLDYFEVNNIDEGLNALDTLLANKKLYRDMVQNGINRAIEYSFSRITDKWRELLFERIPLLRDEIYFKRSRLFNGKARIIYHFLTKKQSLFEYEKQIGFYLKKGTHRNHTLN